MEECCKDFQEMLNSYNSEYFRIGSNKIYGCIRITREGVFVDDGWNVYPEIRFNYCPYCGVKLK
jgi:hypothetical protein